MSSPILLQLSFLSSPEHMLPDAGGLAHHLGPTRPLLHMMEVSGAVRRISYAAFLDAMHQLLGLS